MKNDMLRNSFNNILYKHLFLEFYFHLNTKMSKLFLNENLLLEKHGLIPNIDEYINIANNYFREILNKNDNSQTIILDNNIFSNIDNCIFKKVLIIIEFKNVLNDSKGNAITYFDDYNCFKTKMWISGNNISFSTVFKSLFAHELMHYYENKNEN